MANGKKFSNGNHPVEMLVPMMHLRDAGFEIEVVTPSDKWRRASCVMQRRYRTNPDFRYASACLSASLEPTVEGVACQERELEACDAKPGCRFYSGSRLDLKMRCLEETTPVACVGPNAVHLNALAIGENADGEVYLFWAIVSPSAVTFIDYDVDYPLYSELFEVQPDAWDWPECEPPASL